MRSRKANTGNVFNDSVRGKVLTLLSARGNHPWGQVFPEGNLTKEIMMTSHPFDNKDNKLYATGQEINDYINKSLDCYADVCGNCMQVSGAKYCFNLAPQRSACS